MRVTAAGVALLSKWMPAAQRLIGNARERIDVVRGFGIMSSHQLGARIAGGNRLGCGLNRRLGNTQPGACNEPSHPKVDDLDRALIGNDDIAGLQVAVHDVIMVRIVQRAAERTHQVQRGGRIEVGGSSGAKFLLQGFAREVFHGHEDRVVIPVAIDDADDVRMGQALQLVRLTL